MAGAMALSGGLMCAGSAGAGQTGYTETDLNSFVAAMIAVDCRVNEQNAAKVEQATGFSEDQLKAIVGHLAEKGEITFGENNDGIRLINEGCP